MQARQTIGNILEKKDIEQRHLLLKNILEERRKLINKPASELTPSEKTSLLLLDLNKLIYVPQPDASRTPLMQAAWEGDLESLNLLLAAGADLDIKNVADETALFLAIRQGHINCVKALLNKNNINQSLDEEKITPLLAAAVCDKEDILQLLIEEKANIDDVNKNGLSSLMAAAGNENLTFVKRLLAAKADVRLKDHSGNTALSYAIAARDKEMFETLVKAGSDIHHVNNDGATLFTIAAANERREILDLLIKQYNEEKISPSQYINTIDKNGDTALIGAIAKSNVAISGLLLDMKADPNIHGAKGTPAMFAAFKCGDNSTILKMLIRANADLSIKVNGKTALDYAEEKDHVEIRMIIKQWNKYHSHLYRMFHKSIPEIDYDEIRKDAFKEYKRYTGL